MSRKVKCQDTGEYSTSDVAYKAPDNKYYSSAEAYEQMQKHRQLYQKIYSDLQEILGLNEAEPVPPIIIKVIGKYKNRYDIVAEIFAREKVGIKESIRSKEITNPFNQSRYIQAVIDNNYNQIKSEINELAKISHEQYIEAPTDISNLGRKNRSKDVSKLVGGFSWT